MSINRPDTVIDNPEKLEKQRTALLLVETHRGAGHMNVISKLSKELISRGFKVVIATGSMDVGANFDYGNAVIEELDRLSFHPEKPFAEHNGYEFRFPNNRTLRRHLNSIHFSANNSDQYSDEDQLGLSDQYSDEDQLGLRVIIKPKKLQSRFFLSLIHI